MLRKNGQELTGKSTHSHQIKANVIMKGKYCVLLVIKKNSLMSPKYNLAFIYLNLEDCLRSWKKALEDKKNIERRVELMELLGYDTILN